MSTKDLHIIVFILAVVVLYQGHQAAQVGKVPNTNGTPTILPLGNGQGNPDASSSAPMPSLMVGAAAADTFTGLSLLS